MTLQRLESNLAYPCSHSKEDPMPPDFSITVATGGECRTYTAPYDAAGFVSQLTLAGENALITVNDYGELSERAIVHGVDPADLALERLEIEPLDDADPGLPASLSCRLLRLEAAPESDMPCTQCQARSWWIAIVDCDVEWVHRLRTCRNCGFQLRTAEIPESEFIGMEERVP